MSFGLRSLAGIGATTDLGYVNSIGKDRDGQRAVQNRGGRAVALVREDV